MVPRRVIHSDQDRETDLSIMSLILLDFSQIKTGGDQCFQALD